MTEDERLDLIDAGAAARAAGHGFLANPAYLPGQEPRRTGEPRDAWLDRVTAWHAGWEAENAARSGAGDERVARLLRALGRVDGPGRCP